VSLLVFAFSATFWFANRYVRTFPPLAVLVWDPYLRFPGQLQFEAKGVTLQFFDARGPVQGPDQGAPDYFAWEDTFRRNNAHAERLGFRFTRFASIEQLTGPRRASLFEGYYTFIAVPYAFVVVCTAILPVLWVRSSRARALKARRLESGLCVHCGYDLRASGDTCPECGTRVAAKPPG
jgi:hypothetical protein